MIVIVSTPLRLLASYAITFAAGAALAHTLRKSNRADTRPLCKAKPAPGTAAHTSI